MTIPFVDTDAVERGNANDEHVPPPLAVEVPLQYLEIPRGRVEEVHAVAFKCEHDHVAIIAKVSEDGLGRLAQRREVQSICPGEESLLACRLRQVRHGGALRTHAR